jgi:hypothetical protein
VSTQLPLTGPTHAELVLRACRWLSKTKRCAVVFAEAGKNVCIEEPDAIGFRLGVSLVVECKVSRSDFLADAKKGWRTYPGREHGMGQERWYLCPDGLLKPEEMPEKHGLLYVRGRTVVVVREAERRPDFSAMEERDWLYCVARRHALGVRWIPEEYRFETTEEGNERARVERHGGAA